MGDGANDISIPRLLMVGIPPIKMVMNGGWFIIAIPTSWDLWDLWDLKPKKLRSLQDDQL